MTWFDRIWMPGIRRIPASGPEKTLYLTFDDGPDPASTPRVLRRLQDLGVRASFFVIAERAQAHRSLLKEIQSAGHAIGNHSFDHRYGDYFRGRRAMVEWVHRSQETLTELLGEPPVGFRPPAGIRTPELHYALRSLNLPLILWDLRFFDAVRSWTPGRALAGLRRARPGSIVLLHDAQPEARITSFLDTLAAFCENASREGSEYEHGFQFRGLPSDGMAN